MTFPGIFFVILSDQNSLAMSFGSLMPMRISSYFIHHQAEDLSTCYDARILHPPTCAFRRHVRKWWFSITNHGFTEKSIILSFEMHQHHRYQKSETRAQFMFMENTGWNSDIKVFTGEMELETHHVSIKIATTCKNNMNECIIQLVPPQISL